MVEQKGESRRDLKGSQEVQDWWFQGAGSAMTTKVRTFFIQVNSPRLMAQIHVGMQRSSRERNSSALRFTPGAR